LGTATPITYFGTTTQGAKIYNAANSLLLTLTPASGKNLNTVTAGQLDVIWYQRSIPGECNPLVP